MPQQHSEIFEQTEWFNIKFVIDTAVGLNTSTTGQTKAAAFTHLTKRQFLSVIEYMEFSSVKAWNTECILSI